MNYRMLTLSRLCVGLLKIKDHLHSGFHENISPGGPRLRQPRTSLAVFLESVKWEARPAFIVTDLLCPCPVTWNHHSPRGQGALPSSTMGDEGVCPCNLMLHMCLHRGMHVCRICVLTYSHACCGFST